jgi:flagellar biosynthesis/type III secretory pathway chaperone
MDKRIKELAEQAALTADRSKLVNNNINEFFDEELERFAELIRQDEAKACAEHYLKIMRDAVEQAVLKERKACVTECWVQMGLIPSQPWTVNPYEQCIKAIRARGEK